MEHTDAIGAELRDSVHSLLLPILSDPQMAPSIPAEIKHQIANLGEFMALSRSYIERDRNTREAVGVPVAEGNTRLPKQLCQLARGLALLEGHSEVREEDYKLVCRAAFDSLPLARIAALKAILEGKSPFTIGQPKATVSRALEDLELSGVLVKSRVACQAADTDCPRALSETARELVTGAGTLEAGAYRGSKTMSLSVPAITLRYRRRRLPRLTHTISLLREPKNSAIYSRALRLTNTPAPAMTGRTGFARPMCRPHSRPGAVGLPLPRGGSMRRGLISVLGTTVAPFEAPFRQ